MYWLAIKAFFGGVWKFLAGLPAWVWYGLAALIVAWAIHHHGYNAGRADQAAKTDKVQAAFSDYRNKMIEATKKAEDAARLAEQAQAGAIQAAVNHYKQEQADALAKKDAVIANLRTGNLQLRDHWQGCAEHRAAAASDPGKDDGAAELRDAGAGDLVQIGAEADAQVKYLQGLIASASPRCFKIK